MSRMIDLPDEEPGHVNGAANGMGSIPPSILRQELGKIYEEAERSIAALKSAAEVWGIRPDSPEMMYLDAQMVRERHMSNLVLKFGQAAETAVTAAQQAEFAVKWRLDALKAESDKLVKATINDVGKQISDESVKWNIIREHKWNQTQNWVRVTVLTCVVLAMLLTGFIIRFAIDKTAVLGLVDCEDAPLLVTGSNGSFLACPLSDLASPDTVNELNGEFIHPSQ